MLKPKRNVVWVLALALVFLCSGIASAEGPTFAGTRPANPTMDYTPQNFGIYDTYYEWFNEADCRSCHGASTAERHHATEDAVNGLCLNCHCDYPNVVPPVRDCTQCHTDNAQFCGGGEPQGGNYGSPHHRTDESDSRNCVACHSPALLVETDTVDPPAYDPSSITPTPHACENCHWPTNCAEVLPPRLDLFGATYDQGRVVTGIAGTVCTDNATTFETDWSGWPYLNTAAVPANGYPRPSIIDGAGNFPAPIMANGYMQYGTLNTTGLGFGKAYLAQTGTHHEVGMGLVLTGNVYDKCYSCHANDPDSPARYNPYLPEYEFYIRYCENCHDVGTLHNITEHVTDGPSTNRNLNNNPLPVDEIYTIGGVLGQEVAANTKCVACHGDGYVGEVPALPPAAPFLDAGSPMPNFGSPGIVVQLHGSNFGVQQNDDRVDMRKENPPGSGTYVWEPVPIYSWAEDLVEILVPGGSYWPSLPETSKIRVHKDGVGNSTQYGFTVRKHPEIYAVSPTVVTWSQKIDINGKGFYVKQEKIYPSGYGFSTYVELHASNDKYRVTKYVKATGAPSKWTSTDFAIQLWPDGNPGKELFDIQTGVAVPEPQLYEGVWNVQVVTDYFKDDGDGKYFELSTGRLDIDTVMTGTGPELLSVVEPWNALDGPIGGTGDLLLHRERSEVSPISVVHTPVLNKLKPRAGAYKGNRVKAIGYGFGTAWGTVTVGAKTANIVSWGTTKVVFKMPKFPAGAIGKKKPVTITVPGNGTSNTKRIVYLGLP